MKRIILALMLVLCSLAVSGYTVTTFNDSTSSGTMTLNPDELKYIDLPANATVFNAVMTLTGNATIGDIFTADSTSNAQACTGTWHATNACWKTYDNDWGTFGSAQPGNVAYVYLNFTKPTPVYFGTRWQVKAGATTTNITIPSACINQSPLQLMAMSNESAGSSSFYCYNGSTFGEDIFSIASSSSIFEVESVYWLNTTSDNSSVTNLDVLFAGVSVYSYTGYFPMSATQINLTTELTTCLQSQAPCTVNFTNSNSGATLNYSLLSFSTYPQINISIYDEQTRELIDDRNVTISFIHDDYSANYTTDTGLLFLNIMNWTGQVEIRYLATDYYERSYFFNNVYTNTQQDIILYMLNTTESTLIYSVVQDENFDYLEGALVQTLRYYPEVGGLDSGFEIVSMCQANFMGVCGQYLEKYDPYYKFIIVYDNIVLEETGATQIEENYLGDIEDYLYFTVSTADDILSSWTYLDDIAVNLSWVNSSSYFRLTWIDTDSIIQTMCLDVDRTGLYGSVDVCDSCLSAASGTLTCSINTSQNYTWVATALMESNTNTSTYVVAVASHTISNTIALFGSFGILMALIIIGIMIGIGKFDPSAAIITGLVGLLFVVFSGFYSLSRVAAVTIVLVGLIIMYRNRT